MTTPKRWAQTVGGANAERLLLVLLAVCGLVAAWYSNSGDSGDAGPVPVHFGERGPYAVGNTTLDLPGRQVEVFYPAVDGAAGPALRRRIQESLGEDLGHDIGEGLGADIDVDVVVDAEPAPGGPFPVVLHSHGSGSDRRFSSRHLAHVASWGLVVASPDHPERGLVSAATDDGRGGAAEPGADVDTLAETLDLLTTATIERAGPLEGVIDTERVGVEGHGAGGATALEFGADPQVDAVIALAPELPGPVDQQRQSETTVGRPAPTEIPDKPVMVIAADDVEDGLGPLYDRLGGKDELAVLDRTGPSVFLDVCQSFWEQGALIGLIDEAGHPLDQALRRLGGDGCDPDTDVEPSSVWPVVDHLSVAWYLSAFGPERESAALSLRTGFVADAFPGALAERRR